MCTNPPRWGVLRPLGRSDLRSPPWRTSRRTKDLCLLFSRLGYTMLACGEFWRKARGKTEVFELGYDSSMAVVGSSFPASKPPRCFCGQLHGNSPIGRALDGWDGTWAISIFFIFFPTIIYSFNSVPQSRCMDEREGHAGMCSRYSRLAGLEHAWSATRPRNSNGICFSSRNWHPQPGSSPLNNI